MQKKMTWQSLWVSLDLVLQRLNKGHRLAYCINYFVYPLVKIGSWKLGRLGQIIFQGQ